MMASLALWAIAALHAVKAAITAGQIATGQVDVEGALMVLSWYARDLYWFLFILTAVLVSMWFHRATRHAFARGAKLEVNSPAGAVFSWFIPILQFVWPFSIVRTMLVNAGLETTSVGAWQALWVAGFIATNAAGKLQGTGGAAISVVADLMMVGAAIAGAQIVHRLKWPAA